MRYLLDAVLAVVLALLMVCCHPKDVQYARYHNARFGFEVEYPSFMLMEPAPENGDGFSCHGRGLELLAYGCQNLNSETGALLTLPEVAVQYALPTDKFGYTDGDAFFHGGIDETGNVYLERIRMNPNSDDGNILEIVLVTYPKRKSGKLKPIAERVIYGGTLYMGDMETDAETKVTKTSINNQTTNIQNIMGRFFIRKGQSSTGTILYNVDGNWIREGQSSVGRIVYNIDGNRIREGQSSVGRIVYNIDGNWIREGQSSVGTIRYNIDGNWIREGQSSVGQILCNISEY